MSLKTRIGFVGCGGISESHLKGLAEHPEVSLVAFCDINLSRAEEIAKKYSAGAQLFDSAKTMFSSIELDAAYFCLPPFAHGSELEAVKVGVPFFVEKPINLYLNQAREIASAVAEKKLLTAAGYMNRYRQGIQTVRKLLSDDPAILVLGGWIGGTPRPAPSGGGGIWRWWVEKNKSGGQFHEQVTHTVDIVRFLCGDVEEVHAFAARGLNRGTPENYSIEDASVVNLHFASGAVANLWASCSANAGGGGVSLNIYANQLTALFTGWEHSLRLLQTDKEPQEIKGEPNIFAIEDNAFVQAVRHDDLSKVQSSYADGLKALEVTLAANESMKTGKPVSLG